MSNIAERFTAKFSNCRRIWRGRFTIFFVSSKRVTESIFPLRKLRFPPPPDWKTFFDRHIRTVDDATPITRDEIYDGRLR